jgi:predicted CXXCH cytochrome family protein
MAAMRNFGVITLYATASSGGGLKAAARVKHDTLWLTRTQPDRLGPRYNPSVAPSGWLALALSLLPGAYAQEIDTVIYERDRKGFRLMDQVEDAGERKMLEQLFGKAAAGERLARAEAFLRQYPASAFLSVVYEVAARSCMELQRAACAMDYGAKSLRLLPENPALLVSIAEVQMVVGDHAGARENSRRALRHLDRFARPASYTAQQWEALERQLRAAAEKIAGKRPAETPRHGGQGGRYAGSEACKACHAREYNAWRLTGMARMLRPVREEEVIGKFDGAQFEEGGLAIEMFREGGRLWFALRGQRFPVDYTIGSKWQQAYATKMPDGRIQVFPIQYNRLQGRWYNYWRSIDPPGSARISPERFLELGEAMNYQSNCLPCHTSQSRQVGSEDKPQTIEFAEAGVNCEMCHGPSAAHAGGAKAAFSFKNLDARRYLDICGQCHRQSAMFRPGPNGERNYSGLKDPFWLPARSRPLIEFSRNAFYRDGRFRETTFIVEALERTRCFERGGVHCGHCHNPHPSDAPANLKSLKYPDNPDRMCVTCHADKTGRLHTGHTPGTEASQCVSCHMPRIANTVGFLARTHQIDDIPDVDMTLRFGQAHSPNACLSCHAGENLTELAKRRISRRAGSSAEAQRQ